MPEKYSNLSIAKIAAGIPGPVQFFDGLFAYLQNTFQRGIEEASDIVSAFNFFYFSWTSSHWNTWSFRVSTPYGDATGLVNLFFSFIEEDGKRIARIRFVWWYLTGEDGYGAEIGLDTNHIAPLAFEELRRRIPQEDVLLRVTGTREGGGAANIVLDVLLPDFWNDEHTLNHHMENVIISAIKEKHGDIEVVKTEYLEKPPENLFPDDEPWTAAWKGTLKRDHETVEIYAAAPHIVYGGGQEVRVVLVPPDSSLSRDIVGVLNHAWSSGVAGMAVTSLGFPFSRLGDQTLSQLAPYHTTFYFRDDRDA
jgi:hypothetical protein